MFHSKKKNAFRQIRLGRSIEIIRGFTPSSVRCKIKTPFQNSFYVKLVPAKQILFKRIEMTAEYTALSESKYPIKREFGAKVGNGKTSAPLSTCT